MILSNADIVKYADFQLKLNECIETKPIFRQIFENNMAWNWILSINSADDLISDKNSI